jgi:hypothetical protein
VSYDLLVATRVRPKPSAIDDFARSAGIELRWSGTFTTGTNVLVTRVGDPGGRTIDIDGPARVEPDDLPDDLAGIVTRAGWLVEIHLPGGYDDFADRWALDLAIGLARAGQGAVFDPQADRIAWPSGVTPRKRGAVEERIRTLELVWYLPASHLGPDVADRWLDLVHEHLPTVAPVRFGSYEPFQGRMDKDGPDAFVDAWRAEATIEWGGMLFWWAKSPGLGGSVSFPDPRDDFRPSRLGRAVRLSTALDARPLHRDPDMSDAVVELFAHVADGLGAFYAGGCVERDVIMRRGRVGYDSRSESGPMPRSKWWVGLPALPTWLAWFGDPYRQLLEGRLIGGNVTQRRSGLLLRCGPEPMDVDELRDGTFPDLPSELLATRRVDSTIDPMARITTVLGPPSEAAETIPPLEP